MTKHIIINGTCEHMDEVDDESISLVITSPPYFDAKDYGATGASNIGNSQDELRAYDRYLGLMENVYRECYKKLKYGGHMIINVADVICNTRKYPVNLNTGQVLLKVFNNQGYLDTIMWKKPDGMSSQKRFGIFIQNPHPMYWRPNNMYEPWFVFVKGKKDYSKRKESNKLNWEKYKKFQTDIWEVQPETRKGKFHPAPFPRELPKRFIQLLSYPNDWILDPFLGSGTTMEMARNNGRNSYGYELNMQYIDKAVKPFLGIEQGMKMAPVYKNTLYSIKDLAQNEYHILKQEIQQSVKTDIVIPDKSDSMEDMVIELDMEEDKSEIPKKIKEEVKNEEVHISTPRPITLQNSPNKTKTAEWNKVFGNKDNNASTSEQSFDIVESEITWEGLVKENKKEKEKKFEIKEEEMTKINPLEDTTKERQSAFRSLYIQCELETYVCIDCFDTFIVYMGNVIQLSDEGKTKIISKYENACPSCSSNRLQKQMTSTIRKWKEEKDAIAYGETKATEEEIKMWG